MERNANLLLYFCCLLLLFWPGEGWAPLGVTAQDTLLDMDKASMHIDSIGTAILKVASLGPYIEVMRKQPLLGHNSRRCFFAGSKLKEDNQGLINYHVPQEHSLPLYMVSKNCKFSIIFYNAETIAY